jgi:VIT1/CCC1 family predicted Fe2+/Mn2+ transporter
MWQGADGKWYQAVTIESATGAGADATITDSPQLASEPRSASGAWHGPASGAWHGPSGQPYPAQFPSEHNFRMAESVSLLSIASFVCVLFAVGAATRLVSAHALMPSSGSVLLSLVLPLAVTSLLAFFFGRAAHAKIRRSQSVRAGGGLASLGVVVGFVGILVSIFAGVMSQVH